MSASKRPWSAAPIPDDAPDAASKSIPGDEPFTGPVTGELSEPWSEQLEHLGGSLVWRMGKAEGQEGVVVRLGYAGATPRFAHLPKLRSASDTELQEALLQGTVTVEWVD